ncbi:hypothetical protein [Terrisporobacter petrolearius]|uniref:hypothetical protein n=1 Tax=Terrisporobacter petrolearius TaxID=1460447 RepID=UPI003AFF9845
MFGNGIVTFTTRLTVEVQGMPYEKIENFRVYIAKECVETGGIGSKDDQLYHVRELLVNMD